MTSSRTRWSLVSSLDDEEQLWRFQNADTTVPLSIDHEKGVGLFEGSEGERYEVSLTRCQCRDHVRRRKPCKHMYRLALELGILRPDAWKEVAGHANEERCTEAVVDAGSRDKVPREGKARLSKLCVWSLICGVFSVPLFPIAIFGILGLAFGIGGLRCCRREGKRGKWLGVFGLVTSGFACVIFFAWLVAPDKKKDVPVDSAVSVSEVPVPAREDNSPH